MNKNISIKRRYALIPLILLTLSFTACKVETNTQASPSATASVTISDIDLLQEFHKKAVIASNELVNATKEYNKDYKLAANIGNSADVIKIARKYKDEVANISETINSIETPSLKDEKANSAIRDVGKDLQQLAAFMSESAEIGEDMATRDYAPPSSIARYKEIAEGIDLVLVKLNLEYRQAYNALGYKDSQIDEDNGGLIQAADKK